MSIKVDYNVAIKELGKMKNRITPVIKRHVEGFSALVDLEQANARLGKRPNLDFLDEKKLEIEIMFKEVDLIKSMFLKNVDLANKLGEDWLEKYS